MNSLEDMLTEFFSCVAQKDPKLIKKLNSQGTFSISKSHWQFTLPNLFDFLQLNCFLNESDRYDQFRQALFNSSINKTIEKFNAEIVIENNVSKVDRSIYKLSWHQHNN